jgi:hypothetical protein
MKYFALSTVFLLTSLAPVYAADPVMEVAKLERMAESAQTASEHVEVSKQYRLRAEQFEEKADKHETEAQKLEKQPRSPISHKWPAMSRKPWVKERQLAMHARRAAKESLALADRHLQLSVEALAERSDTRSARNTDR